MKEYINEKKNKTFASKTKKVKELINHTLFILETFGIPMNESPRRLERMAMAFLAVADVKQIEDFETTQDLKNHSHSLKTREVIEYVNKHFQENISSGSYDDIRRKDLKILVLADVVLQSNPNSATNDSRRGYGLNVIYIKKD